MHSAEAPDDLEAQDVRTLDGGPQPLVGLRTTESVREVGVRPETELPVGVVTAPGVLLGEVLVGQRVRPDPDLVEDAGEEHGVRATSLAIRRGGGGNLGSMFANPGTFVIVNRSACGVEDPAERLRRLGGVPR